MAERARQYRRDRAGQFARTSNSPPEGVLRRPVRGVLDATEQVAVQDAFGVGPEQVLRDHAISHTLAAISTIAIEDVVFFRGTALSRTQLPDLRLSDDIDLIALGNRRSVAEHIESAIESELGRSLGTATFEPPLSETKGSEPSVLTVGGSRLQIQLLRGVEQPAWPSEVIDIEQRYSDAPPARLRVLTPAAQVAAKLAAWHDRAAPRDIYDLWALASFGALNGEAARVFGQHGPLTHVSSIQLTRIPTGTQSGRLRWASVHHRGGAGRCGTRHPGRHQEPLTSSVTGRACAMHEPARHIHRRHRRRMPQEPRTDRLGMGGRRRPMGRRVRARRNEQRRRTPRQAGAPRSRSRRRHLRPRARAQGTPAQRLGR